jgi:hypothetical protein
MNCVIKPLQSKGAHLLMAVELSISLNAFIVEERNDDLRFLYRNVDSQSQ